MTIESKSTTKPVEGKSGTKLELQAPLRRYAVETSTTDGKASAFTDISAMVHGVDRKSETARIETQDLRAVAELLVAHADFLEKGK